LNILRIADKWQIDIQKKAALEMLRVRGSPAERIAAARRCDEVRDWLVPAFQELSQLVPPSEKDAKLLGFDDLLRLWYIHRFRSELGDGHRSWNTVRYIKYLALENGALGSFPKDLL
jgi:hypothetical protein